MASKTSKAEELQDQEPDDDSQTVASPKGAKKPAKKTTSRARRAKPTKEVRLKAYWGVFNQSLSAVVMFEHGERKEALKKAEELSDSRKSPHFVQLVKKVIEE